MKEAVGRHRVTALLLLNEEVEHLGALRVDHLAILANVRGENFPITSRRSFLSHAVTPSRGTHCCPATPPLGEAG